MMMEMEVHEDNAIKMLVEQTFGYRELTVSVIVYCCNTLAIDNTCVRAW